MCGKVNSHPEIFQEFKTQGVCRPVVSKTPEMTKYLTYEETKIHPDRHRERLPSEYDKFIEPLPFKLVQKKARFSITCSNKECNKPRIVYTSTQPSDAEAQEVKQLMKEAKYVCGDIIDGHKKFVTRQTMNCESLVETVYYSGLVDSKCALELVCYACGTQVPQSSFEKYIELKKFNCTIPPTCGETHCKQHPKWPFNKIRKRKLDKKWKDKDRLEKRLKVLKARDEVKRENEDVE